MSASPEERDDDVRDEDVVVEEEMADMTDLPPAGHGDDSGGVPGEDGEDHHISELLELERQRSSEQPAEDTGVVNRYKQLVQEGPDATSDNGSTDALPRRAGSPVDSTVSIPDDTPSIQVGCDCSRVISSQDSVRVLTMLGFCPLLSKQQCPPIASL